MSARDDADYYLTFSGHGPAKRAALLDAHAAEVTAAAYRAAADEAMAESHSPLVQEGGKFQAGMQFVAEHLRARADQMEQQ